MQGPGGGIAVALLAVFPLVSGAGELGRITAFLDGQERTWHTITMEQLGGDVATASLTLGARLTELQVQGHPEPRFSTDDMLSLEVRYLGPYAPDATPLSLDIMYMPDGMGGPFWTTRGAPVQPEIDILVLDVWGGFGRLQAVFSGRLCLRRIISSATDPTTCKQVSGLIDTRLVVD